MNNQKFILTGGYFLKIIVADKKVNRSVLADVKSRTSSKDCSFN